MPEELKFTYDALGLPKTYSPPERVPVKAKKGIPGTHPEFGAIRDVIDANYTALKSKGTLFISLTVFFAFYSFVPISDGESVGTDFLPILLLSLIIALGLGYGLYHFYLMTRKVLLYETGFVIKSPMKTEELSYNGIVSVSLRVEAGKTGLSAILAPKASAVCVTRFKDGSARVLVSDYYGDLEKKVKMFLQYLSEGDETPPAQPNAENSGSET